MGTFQPSDARQAAEIVAWAAAETQPLEILAGGTKRALGRPSQTEHVLDISGLAGIVAYDPPELILTSRAATPMAEIAAQLDAHRQMLAFEPPDWRGLLGTGGEPTLGGMLACNLAGPRRVRAGAPRDFLLGFSALNGWGDAWKAGGKVVKNVTGYDMCKLQAGAFGTLSLLTELTFKVMPKPETACTVLLLAMGDEVALPALAQALNSPYEVSAAAHLPAAAARRSGVPAVAEGLGAVTALRLEGPGPSVAYRADALEALVGRGARLDAAETAQLWAEIGTVRPLLGAAPRYVWRVCPTPSSVVAVVQAVHERLPSAEAFYDWAGGLVWLSLDPGDAGSDAGEPVVRAAARHAGGHATLVVAPDTVRAVVPVFEPVTGALAALTARVKNGFDPRRILNPGRIYKDH
jgi:glycolate oxidase FAD binding subunit